MAVVEHTTQMSCALLHARWIAGSSLPHVERHAQMLVLRPILKHLAGQVIASTFELVFQLDRTGRIDQSGSFKRASLTRPSRGWSEV